MAIGKRRVTTQGLSAESVCRRHFRDSAPSRSGSGLALRNIGVYPFQMVPKAVKRVAFLIAPVARNDGGQPAEPAVAQQQAGRRLEKRSQIPLLGIATPRVM